MNKKLIIKEKIRSQKCFFNKLKLMQPSLLAFAKSKIFNSSDAEDIVSKTTSIIVEKKSTYKKDGNFYAWCFSILHFQIKAFFTKAKRNREHLMSEDFSPDSFSHSLFQVNSRLPFEPLLKKELEDEQRKTLEGLRVTALSEREREFFDHHMSGKSKSFIINAMNLPKETHYYTWKARVIKRLKSHACTK
jgi:DNA-directed RNA polymerase specialized sigma24 family protein